MPTKGWCSSPTTSWRRRSSKVRRGARYATGSLQVYVSFDIDGLSPDNCPHTGTPVPGGLSFREAVYLLAAVVESGREIVGFDLCEVGPSRDGEWDANVGARVLYKLCNLTLKSC